MKKYLTLIFIFFLLSLAFMNIPFVNSNPENSITYTIDFPQNYITVDGTYPDVFESIYQADQSGGWNVFTKIGNNVYACNNTRVDFGDNINETIVSDSLCSVNFFGGSSTAFRVRNNATANFGILINETEKTTRDGVSFIIEDYYYVTLESGSVTNFYGCSIESDENVEIDFFGSGKVYRSSFTSGYYMIVTYTNSDYEFYNLYVAYDYEVAFEPHETHEMNFITLVESPYNLKIHHATPSGVTIRNLYCRRALISNIWCYLAGNNRTIYLINADLDEWGIKWTGTGNDKLYRSYEFDLIVTYPNRTVINGTKTGARVEIQHFGNNSGVDYNATLNEDGTINTTILSMGFYNQTGGNNIYDYNPFNIRIYNITGYVEYNGNFTLNKKEYFCVNICSYSDIDYTLPIALLISFGLIVLLLVIAKRKWR